MLTVVGYEPTRRGAIPAIGTSVAGLWLGFGGGAWSGFGGGRGGMVRVYGVEGAEEEDCRSSGLCTVPDADRLGCE